MLNIEKIYRPQDIIIINYLTLYKMSTVARMSALLGLLTLVQGSQDDPEQLLMTLMEERNKELLADIPQGIVEGLLELAQRENGKGKRARPEPESREYSQTPFDKQEERKRRKERTYTRDLLQQEGMDEAMRHERAKREQLGDDMDPWPLRELKASPEYAEMTPYQRRTEEQKVKRDLLLGKYPSAPPKDLKAAPSLADEGERAKTKEQQRKEASKSLRERFIAPEYGDGYEPLGPSSEEGEPEPATRGKRKGGRFDGPMRLQQELDDELDAAKSKPDSELSPYEKALRENERQKQNTLEDLRREAEERERQAAEPEGEEAERVPHAADHENTLCPSCVPEHDGAGEEAEAEAGEDGANPYKQALKDNEKRKAAFIEELKAAADARKKQDAEDKARAEEEAAFTRENLEREYEETGEMPQELADLIAEEEAKAAEEEANKRPEPPSAQTMKDRVNEESKRRKDAHMQKMREEAEEEKRQKQAARDAETARRRIDDPNYEPPPPLTVPKGKPSPPPGYQLPKTAEDFFNPDGTHKPKEPTAPAPKEADPPAEEEAKEKKEPQKPVLQHPLPAPETHEVEEPATAQREERPDRHHKPKKAHRPQPETSKPEQEYVSSSDSYGPGFRHDLPEASDSDWEYSSSGDDHGYKYNLPKSGPKPETRRPDEPARDRKPRRRKDQDHSRQKEHLAEFEEAERHQMERNQRHKEREEKQAERDRAAQREADRERREKGRQEKERAEQLAQQREQERHERELAEEADRERQEQQEEEARRLERERRQKLRQERELEDGRERLRTEQAFAQELEELLQTEQHEKEELDRLARRERGQKDRRDGKAAPKRPTHLPEWSVPDYYDSDDEGDHGRPQGTRKKPESRKRYVEDAVEDYEDRWPETQTLPWPGDDDQPGLLEQQMQEDRRASSKHDPKEPGRRRRQRSEPDSKQERPPQQEEPRRAKSRQLDEWMAPAESPRSRPEALDPWAEADPAALPWPGAEPEGEALAASLPWPEAEPRRTAKQPGRKHQRPEEPSLADLEASFAWPAGFQTLPWPEETDEERRKKRPKGRKARPARSRHDEERGGDTAWYVPAADDVPAPPRPHHAADSRRPWYLPDEGIHGAPVEDTQPPQRDPGRLEELWYLPRSEKGTPPKDSKPAEPKLQESRPTERAQEPKAPQRHGRKTQLPHGVGEHGDQQWYLPEQQPSRQQHRPRRDLDGPLVEAQEPWYLPPQPRSAQRQRHESELDLLQAFETERGRVAETDYSAAWPARPSQQSRPYHAQQPRDRDARSPFAAPRAAEEADEAAAFEAWSHQQQRGPAYAPEYGTQHRPQRRHDYRAPEPQQQRRGDQRQFPMPSAPLPLPSQEERPARMPQGPGRNPPQRRYHGHSPRHEYEPARRYDGTSDEEYARANAGIAAEALSNEPFHQEEEYIQNEYERSGTQPTQIHPYFQVPAPHQHQGSRDRYQRSRQANLPLGFEGLEQLEEASSEQSVVVEDATEPGTLLRWFEELDQHRQAQEQALSESPEVRMTDQFFHSNALISGGAESDQEPSSLASPSLGSNDRDLADQEGAEPVSDAGSEQVDIPAMQLYAVNHGSAMAPQGFSQSPQPQYNALPQYSPRNRLGRPPLPPRRYGRSNGLGSLSALSGAQQAHHPSATGPNYGSYPTSQQLRDYAYYQPHSGDWDGHAAYRSPYGYAQDYFWDQPYGYVQDYWSSDADYTPHRPPRRAREIEQQPDGQMPYHFGMTSDPAFRTSNGFPSDLQSAATGTEDQDLIKSNSYGRLQVNPFVVADKLTSLGWKSASTDETIRQRTEDARKYKVASSYFQSQEDRGGSELDGLEAADLPQNANSETPRQATPKLSANEIVPNRPKPADAKEKKRWMEEELGSGDHQRMLKDEYARRIAKEKEKEPDRPAPKQPPKAPSLAPGPKPAKESPEREKRPQDFKSMTEYAKHVREKKEQEMKLEEERKMAEDPDYVPKTPLSPTLPKKDDEKKKKGDDAKSPPGDKPPSAKTLFDQIQEQKELRERQKKEEDPDYEPKTLPNAKAPKDQFTREDPAVDESATLFEQATAMRRLKEKQLLEEDEARGAQDPTYTRRFRTIPEVSSDDEMEAFTPYAHSPRGIPTPAPRPPSVSSESSESTLSPESSESTWSADSESEWEQFASPYGDPYDFWHFDLPKPTRHQDHKRSHQPASYQERDRRRDKQHRRSPRTNAPLPTDQYLYLSQNQPSSRFSPGPYDPYDPYGAPMPEYGQAPGYDFQQPLPMGYFDPWAPQIPMGYGWQEPAPQPFQASTSASDSAKRALDQQQFSFEIDWDYGQTRGLYEAPRAGREPEYFDELTGADAEAEAEADAEEEEVEERAAPEPEQKPKTEKKKGKGKKQAKDTAEVEANEGRENKKKGKGKPKGKSKKGKAAGKNPKFYEKTHRGWGKQGLTDGEDSAEEGTEEVSDDFDADFDTEGNFIGSNSSSSEGSYYSNSESDGSSDDSSGYSENSDYDEYSESASNSAASNHNHRMPKPYYSNPLGFSPENFSPQELKRRMTDRRDPDSEKGLSFLNLSVAAPLMDLKQDQVSNKGEEENLHLVREFEDEEIERAKEYEHRAQMWDEEHGYESEFEMNGVPHDALADADSADMDDLLGEVNKVLHTRFKNMYEGEMLLPNLEYNPDYEAPF